HRGRGGEADQVSRLSVALLILASHRMPMAELSLSAPSDIAAAHKAPSLRRLARYDHLFHILTRSAAIAVLATLGGVMIALVIGAWPALRQFGFEFLWTQTWNPVTEKFGALAPIYGTIVTSLLALLFAVPVGIGVAIFLTEICPPI